MPPKAADLGLQLRIAAERGKALECKRLLAAGATVAKDSVRYYMGSHIVYIRRFCCKFKEWCLVSYLLCVCAFLHISEWAHCSAQGCQVWTHWGAQGTDGQKMLQCQHSRQGETTTPHHQLAGIAPHVYTQHYSTDPDSLIPHPFVQYGWTALHWAAWNGHTTTITCLVGHNGCIINTSDKVSPPMSVHLLGRETNFFFSRFDLEIKP